MANTQTATTAPKGVLTHMYPIANAFGLNVDKKWQIKGGNPKSGHPNVPKKVTPYVFRGDFIQRFTMWWAMPASDEGYWIGGPTGAGKTSVVQQFMSRINVPLQVIPISKSTRFNDLIVEYVPNDKGGLDAVPGVLTKAVMEGYPVLFDELDRADPRETSKVHSLMENGYVCHPRLNDGQPIYKTDGFRVIATGNSMGGGDDAGIYRGVNVMDLAFSDRFIIDYVGYMEREVELALLEKRFPNLPAPVREQAVDFANEVRQLFVGNDDEDDNANAIGVTISTRKLIQLCHYASLMKGVRKKGVNPLKAALDLVLIQRAAVDERDAIYLALESVEKKQAGAATA